MNPTTSFKDVDAWKKSHEFVLNVYKITESFPKSETFGLISQFRRSAVSIAANIAEGYKKKTSLDKLRFYNISQGSIEECRYYILLSKDLEYLSVEKYQSLDQEIELCSKLLNNYCRSIAKSIKT